MANFVNRFEKWGRRSCRFRPSWHYCWGLYKNKETFCFSGVSKLGFPNSGSKLMLKTQELRSWISGLFQQAYWLLESLKINNNQTGLIDKRNILAFFSSAVMWGNVFRKLHLFPIWWQWNWSMQDKNLSMQWKYLSIKVGLFHFCHYWTRNYDYYRVCD